MRNEFLLNIIYLERENLRTWDPRKEEKEMVCAMNTGASTFWASFFQTLLQEVLTTWSFTSSSIESIWQWVLTNLNIDLRASEISLNAFFPENALCSHQLTLQMKEARMLGRELMLPELHLQQMKLKKMVPPETKSSREKADTEQQRKVWPSSLIITI